MKTFWEINARKLSFVLAYWFIATNVLVGLVHTLGWWPFKLLLFLCIIFLPGVALLRLLRIALRAFSVGVLYAFGLSLLVLMLSGLAANQILPLLGVARPLELLGILGAWDITTVVLIGASILVNPQPVRFTKWPKKGFPATTWLFVVLSLLLPCGAALGAFRLNNGGGPLLTELTLGYGALLIAYAFIWRRHLPSELLAWFVFMLGLSVLFMTSLRGWDIVGHDIEREFRAYTLTHQYGHWNIALDRDPYNACLSITILPEMFARLLHISGLVVFKVILQIIFAACPVVIYVLLRRYVFKLGALTGSLLFICYPTFITDSAMLTRQGVAYLFFALALIIISNRAQIWRYKILFVLCALGAILSHYSTAYMFVALFSVAVVCKLCLTWWQSRQRKRGEARPQPTVLSPLFVGILFFITFMWYTQLTATSGGLLVTLRSSLGNISKVFSADNKSSDTSTALLFAGGKTQVDLYQSYLTDSHSSHADQKANTPQYLPTLTGDNLPLTQMGQKARTVDIHSSLISELRQNFAKILQLLALTGVIYVTYRLFRRKPDDLEPDFICLNVAGLVLLILMVLLPILSINYGILRAFQQSLIFLILPITFLLMRVSLRLWTWVKVTLATSGVVVLFLLFTGLFAQVLGGTSPALSMNNSGLYYGLYYSSEAEAQSFTWIKAHVAKKADVRAANFNKALMHDPGYPFTKSGILPSQISARTYVYLDPAQVQAQMFYTYFESSPIIMTFPLDYYDNTKSLLYSTPSTRVYR